MVTVDTNVLVRLLTRDQEEEFQRAYRVFQTHPVFIPTTVILETEWVLRYAYHFASKQVIGALRGAFGLPNVKLEDSIRISRALRWHELGLDFADALHLAASCANQAFLSFDRRLAKRALRCTDIVVREPD